MDSEANKRELMYEFAAMLGQPINDEVADKMLAEIPKAGFVLATKEAISAGGVLAYEMGRADAYRKAAAAVRAMKAGDPSWDDTLDDAAQAIEALADD